MMEKFSGCMYGLAIGDAVGYPVEFYSNKDLGKLFGGNGVTGPQGSYPARYSDDTQMSLAIADALVSAGRAWKLDDTDYVMGEVSREFVKWLESQNDPQNRRAPGNTCLRGCSNLKNGVYWKESGVPQSKGCGSAMRSAPIGLVYHSSPDKLREIAIASSQATHGHPAALAGSVGTAYLVAQGLKETEPRHLPEALLEFTSGMSEDFTFRIEEVMEVLNLEPREAFQRLGEGWVAEEAVAGALYSFLKSPRDYSKAVLTAVNYSGDRDSVGCIAGAISGAYNGAGAIPSRWKGVIENAPKLREISQKLWGVAR